MSVAIESQVEALRREILDRCTHWDTVPTNAEILLLFEAIGTVVPGVKGRFEVIRPEGDRLQFSGRYSAWDWYYDRFVDTKRNPWQ